MFFRCFAYIHGCVTRAGALYTVNKSVQTPIALLHFQVPLTFVLKVRGIKGHFGCVIETDYDSKGNRIQAFCFEGSGNDEKPLGLFGGNSL